MINRNNMSANKKLFDLALELQFLPLSFAMGRIIMEYKHRKLFLYIEINRQGI